MIKNNYRFLIKIIPSILITVIFIYSFNFWWQLLAPESFFNNQTILICFPLPNFLLVLFILIAITLKAIIASTFYYKQIGYNFVKWLLAIIVIASIYLLYEFIPIIWDYKEFDYVDDLVIRKDLTFNDKFFAIYMPLTIIISIIALSLYFLNIWYKVEISNQFVSKPTDQKNQ
jgi:hypothetical protein